MSLTLLFPKICLFICFIFDCGGVHCCAWAFSSCGEWGLLCCGACASHGGGSLIAEHSLEDTQASVVGLMGSVVVTHECSCSKACGIFLGQGQNHCHLNWQADPLPLSHQGDPYQPFLIPYSVLRNCKHYFTHSGVFLTSCRLSPSLSTEAGSIPGKTTQKSPVSFVLCLTDVIEWGFFSYFLNYKLIHSRK